VKILEKITRGAFMAETKKFGPFEPDLVCTSVGKWMSHVYIMNACQPLYVVEWFFCVYVEIKVRML